MKPPTPAQLARLNRLCDGPAPFEPGDLELSAAGMVVTLRDGLTELTGAWTLDQMVEVSGLGHQPRSTEIDIQTLLDEGRY